MLCPGLIVRDAKSTEVVKSPTREFTLNRTVIVLVVEPLTPCRVNVYVPAAVDLSVDTVSTEVACPDADMEMG